MCDYPFGFLDLEYGTTKHKVYYMEENGDSSQIWAMVNLVKVCQSWFICASFWLQLALIALLKKNLQVDFTLNLHL
jgi:hypothetical protein